MNTGASEDTEVQVVEEGNKETHESRNEINFWKESVIIVSPYPGLTFAGPDGMDDVMLDTEDYSGHDDGSKDGLKMFHERTEHLPCSSCFS